MLSMVANRLFPLQPVDNKALYDALEIAKDASDADIKKAYRRLALKVRPHLSSVLPVLTRHQFFYALPGSASSR